MSKTNPPRSGVWLVTRDDDVEECIYQHPGQRLIYPDGDGWLGPGCHNLSHEPVNDIVAWRPYIRPYSADGSHLAKMSGSRIGDRVSSVIVETLEGKELPSVELDSGERLRDSIQVNDIRAAIDDLFIALFSEYLDLYWIELYSRRN